MSRQRGIKYTIAAISWWIVLTYGLFRPVDDLQIDSYFVFPGDDKLIHVVLFAILTILVEKSIMERGYQRKPLRSFFMLSLYGLMTEMGQAMTDYRGGDIWDFLADCLGICVALLIFRIF